MKTFLAIITTLLCKCTANNNYYVFRPNVQLDNDVLLLNISLSETKNASVTATQSTIHVSSEYKETLYTKDGIVHNQVNNYHLYNQNYHSHWSGNVTFYDLDDVYHGKIIFSTCGIKKSCPVNDPHNSIQYIKGEIRDYSNNQQYSIFPQDTNMCPDNSNIQTGTTIFDHRVKLTNYHRMLQDHNHTENETELCGGGIYPDDSDDFQVQILTNYSTSSNKRYALFKVAMIKKDAINLELMERQMKLLILCI